MPIPNFPAKLNSRAIIEPEGALKYRASLNRLPTEPPPRSVILLYCADHLQHFIDVLEASATRPQSRPWSSAAAKTPRHSQWPQL
jgi:hypothetical protein